MSSSYGTRFPAFPLEPIRNSPEATGKAYRFRFGTIDQTDIPVKRPVRQDCLKIQKRPVHHQPAEFFPCPTALTIPYLASIATPRTHLLVHSTNHDEDCPARLPPPDAPFSLCLRQEIGRQEGRKLHRQFHQQDQVGASERQSGDRIRGRAQVERGLERRHQTQQCRHLY